MKKSTKRLRLSAETIRTLESGELREIVGGMPRLRTITCDNDECVTYACLTQVGCA